MFVNNVRQHSAVYAKNKRVGPWILISGTVFILAKPRFCDVTFSHSKINLPTFQKSVDNFPLGNMESQQFLGAFAKFRKATISFVMPVCCIYVDISRLSVWSTSIPRQNYFQCRAWQVPSYRETSRLQAGLSCHWHNNTNCRLHNTRYHRFQRGKGCQREMQNYKLCEGSCGISPHIPISALDGGQW